MNRLFAIVAVLSLTGCTTIYFENNTQAEQPSTDILERWHHNSVFALVEVSDPVNLSNECEGADWATVKSETSFINGLIGWIPYVGIFWTPKTVTVQCAVGSEQTAGITSISQ